MNAISETPPAALRDEFWAKAGHIPESAADWASQHEEFRRWRADSRFEAYWPTIDRLLDVDYDATRRWAAAAQAAPELRESGYDLDACRQQRDYDLKHAHDHLP